MSGGESRTADDVGTRTRTKTPIEAVADIDHSRVLIIDETSGRVYIKQNDCDEYHWYTVNRHGAFCGQWFWDRLRTRDVVTSKLRSDHCQRTEHKQLSDLKSRIQHGLRRESKS
jgi:hypothetical protein